MEFQQAILSIDGKTYSLQPNKANSFNEIYVDFNSEDSNGGRRWSIFLHPKQDVLLQRLEVCFHVPTTDSDLFFSNGYQSWSESRLYRLDEGIARLNPLARKHLGYSGDEHIAGIPRGRGRLHAWTYTYFKKRASSLLFGSLSERTGFTLFLYDRATQLLTVRKDLDAMHLTHSFPALDFWAGESTEEDVFNAWFLTMELPQPPVETQALGWTSWYRHFNKISAELLQNDLEQVAASELPFRYFQIDDGWQSAVGDWLSVKNTFPNGMGALAARIREKGLTPGLWMAPFVAAANSDLARRNPDWLLKGADGKPVKAGYNPMWGGWYFALDFYHGGVRDYLSGVFHMALDKWGYDWLKLDFLFAVCLRPPEGKTRGGVMWEAMEFLRTLAGHRKILACGVPLGACFGQVDYCRIGGDTHLAWEHPLLGRLHHRERVSTLAALRSTIGRRQLQGRAFISDPDVFLLRRENQRLTTEQQNTLLSVNTLLGGVLFCSDDPGAYSPEQRSELESALDLKNSIIQGVILLQPDVYRIDFEQSGQRFAAFCNLGSHTVSPEATVQLLPFETLILGR